MALTTTRFDSAAYLDSDEAVGAYLDEALETADPAFIVQALGTVVRARGMTQIAKDAGLSRESLYKALQGVEHGGQSGNRYGHPRDAGARSAFIGCAGRSALRFRDRLVARMKGAPFARS